MNDPLYSGDRKVARAAAKRALAIYDESVKDATRSCDGALRPLVEQRRAVEKAAREAYESDERAAKAEYSQAVQRAAENRKEGLAVARETYDAAAAPIVAAYAEAVRQAEMCHMIAFSEGSRNDSGKSGQ